MTKAITLEDLAARANRCFACDEMDYVHLLSAANGSPSAAVMCIGEAPGRLGAAQTGVPFTRDQSGRRFERLLETARLRRADVFVTNALLCNPLRAGGNRPPRRSETAACSGWLKAQIDLLGPWLVVTLGQVALAATRLIEPHDFELRRDIGLPMRWYGRTLVPTYHPSPRTVARRPFDLQLEDWRKLGRLIRDQGAATPPAGPASVAAPLLDRRMPALTSLPSLEGESS